MGSIQWTLLPSLVDKGHFLLKTSGNLLICCSFGRLTPVTTVHHDAQTLSCSTSRVNQLRIRVTSSYERRAIPPWAVVVNRLSSSDFIVVGRMAA